MAESQMLGTIPDFSGNAINFLNTVAKNDIVQKNTEINALRDAKIADEVAKRDAAIKELMNNDFFNFMFNPWFKKLLEKIKFNY